VVKSSAGNPNPTISIRIAPTIDPIIVPFPPNRLVPPIITAAITFSSLPSPRMGFPPELRAAYAKPARDAVNPQKVNAGILIKSVLTPEKRAAASLPPVPENSKSVLRRISGRF